MRRRLAGVYIQLPCGWTVSPSRRGASRQVVARAELRSECMTPSPMILRHTSRERQDEFMALYRRWLRRGGIVYLVDKTTLETRSADAEPVRSRMQVSW